MLQGYDVSNHQAGLDLSTLSSDFFIMKATEGLGFVDAYCDAWIQWCINNNKPFGFYHFMTAQNPVAQADYFVNNTKNYFGKGIPVLDFEANGLLLGSSGAKQFLDRVFELTGVRPLIYTSSSVTFQHNWTDVVNANYGLWVADYSSKAPAVKYWSSYAMWQHTSTPLDHNYFYGDVTAWNKYVGKSAPSVAPAPPVSSNEMWVDELGDAWTKTTGTHTLTTAANLRYGARPTSNLITTLPAGSKINYDAKSNHGGYTWLRQPRANGSFGYIVQV